MKKQLLTLAIPFLSATCLFSQDLHIEKEKWAEKPVLHVLDGKYAKESAIVVLNKKRIEFVDEPKNEVAEYSTLHKIIHINDDRGIEGLNKIYLGVSENSDIVDIKARAILPGGKIIELDKKNIKDVKEQDGNIYKIFAMEGLEKGCDMEYFYTYKRPASFFGREIVETNIPSMETILQIVSPDRLRFDVKPYNFTVAVSDTVINNKRTTECRVKEVAGAETEKYSDEEAVLKRIEYKLSYNDLARKGERLFTWNELAKRIYGIYTSYNEKELKMAADLVAQNGWDKITDEPAKIIAIENFIKKNYSYNEQVKSDEADKLEVVIKNKVGGQTGILRLYCAVFQSVGLNYQVVLVGDRSKFVIDKELENWDNCENALFYFPAEKKFLAPTRPDYRYPWILPTWSDTKGLFCKRTSIGNFSTALGEIKNIDLEDYTKSFENIDTKLELTASGDSLNVDAKLTYAGYLSVNYRDAFNYANEEQQRVILKEMAKNYASSENIITSKILNKDFESQNTNVPLVLNIQTKSGELIERAGNKLIIKIGMAIGPQVEMYQDKPRQHPVDMEFGHIEERKIDFVIPAGYTISNPNDLKIDQTYKEDGELTMGFVSDYEIKGNLLSIHIMEQYKKPVYPLNQFNQFRKIINASSDFNKIVLVLEKKS